MTIRIARDGGEPRALDVTRSGERATVWIDGTPTATTSTVEAGATVIEIEGRRETVFTAVERDTVYVHAFGRMWTLRLSDPVESNQREGRSADAATAPMPGTLVSLAVAAGDAVARGQIVAVIESMKMQTEIAAPRDGVVERVLVEAGGAVDGGAPLVTLEALQEED